MGLEIEKLKNYFAGSTGRGFGCRQQRGAQTARIGEKMVERPSPHNSEYCLYRAIECEQQAEQAVDAKNRAIYLDLASRWRLLASETGESSFQPVGGKTARSSLEPVTGR
jgi:hypothetical protein